MCNPEKNRVHQTRDIIWLNSVYIQDTFTTVFVEGKTQFDYGDINDIEVGEIDHE